MDYESIDHLTEELKRQTSQNAQESEKLSFNCFSEQGVFRGGLCSAAMYLATLGLAWAERGTGALYISIRTPRK